MGSDPNLSVVNGVNQSWDVPNLFVLDGASFTSNSTVGPALTLARTGTATEHAPRQLGVIARVVDKDPVPHCATEDR
jgi:choline dehydrogenase-like flavoprotein